MKKIATILSLLFISSTVFADVSSDDTKSFPASIICDNSRIEDIVYDQFANSYRLMKNPFTIIYKAVSQDTNTVFKQNCTTLTDANQIRIESFNQACKSSCGKNAESFYKDDVLFKKSKIKELFSECSMICNMADEFVNGYIQGHTSVKRLD
jgi:hypothetical protein